MSGANRPVAVLFDIDGTLIDTGGAGARSWSSAFEEVVGHPFDIGTVTSGGETDPVIVRAAFEADQGRPAQPEELGRLIAAYLAGLPAAVAESSGYRVLPGVPEALSRLAGEGVLLGLTTGTFEAAAHIKLARGGLEHRFAFGGYGSDAADRAELTRRGFERAEHLAGRELDPARVLVVGDTPRDVAAAHGAGLVSVGVATGRYSVGELSAAGADRALADLTEPL